MNISAMIYIAKQRLRLYQALFLNLYMQKHLLLRALSRLLPDPEES